MVCGKCGFYMEDGAAFCVSCGQRAETVSYQQFQSGDTVPLDNVNTFYGTYSNGQNVGTNPDTSADFGNYAGGQVQNNNYAPGYTYTNQNSYGGNGSQPPKSDNKIVKIILITVPVALILIAGIVFAILHFTGKSDSDNKKTVTTEVAEETTEDDDSETQENISVEFEKNNENIYISSYTAQLAVTIIIKDGKILRYGCELYNEDKDFLAHKEFSYDQPSENDSFPAIIDTQDDMDYTLNDSTTYWYRFYVVTKEQKIYSPYQSFTTSLDNSDDYTDSRDDYYPYDDYEIEGARGKVYNTNGKGLYVRKGPSTSEETIVCSKDGQYLDILDEKYNSSEDLLWYKVSYTKNGKTYTGWSCADYIQIVD